MIEPGNQIGIVPPPASAASVLVRGLPALRRRHLILAPIFAAHAALLVWIAADRLDATPPRVETTMAVFDVLPVPTPLQSSPAPAEAEPVVLVAPPVIAPTIVPLQVAMPITAAALPAPVAGGCDLTDTMQAALRADPEARVSLAGMPPQARSVANAVMLWDGGWIDRSAALDPIRTIVLSTLRAASADCREATQAGPRLIVIAGRPDFVLAIGSGRWRWGDLDTLQEKRADTAPLLSAARLAMQ